VAHEGQFLALIELLRERVGEVRFAEELELARVKSPGELKPKEAFAFYARLHDVPRLDQGRRG